MRLNLKERVVPNKPINAAQFDHIAAAVLAYPEQRAAVKRHVIDGVSARQAEREAYGKDTKTVSRDAKKVRAVFEWAMRLEAAGPDKV